MAGVIYTDQMFNLGGAAVTSLTSMNAGTGSTAAAYSPQLDGVLLTINFWCTPQAATSLAQQGRIELSQSNWSPNVLRFPFAGFGLATAPQAIGGNGLVFTRAVNQIAKTSWPITGQVIYFFSPVTPAVIVEGVFSA